LNKFEEVLRGLRCSPWNPGQEDEERQTTVEVRRWYLFAWLRIPLPFKTGITDVEAVLKDTTNPSAVKGIAEPLSL